MRFPDGFVWGASTSAYQIEGAVSEDGRGDSIWDTFAREPGRVWNGDTGENAADHYHRFREDVALIGELGLPAYRFSISWPRIQPGGRGPVNQSGLDFYRRLVDALLQAGIEPYATLFHWDLPQELQDEGGWPARETAFRFAEYAEIVAGELGDRIHNWMTLNEPWCAAFLGYGLGLHAPGIHDGRQAVAAGHHLMLAHGLAVPRIRAAAPGSDVGIVLNLAPQDPASDSDADVAAARLGDAMLARFFLDPILRGRYADEVLDHLEPLVDLSHIEEGDAAIIAAPIDVLGINYYHPSLVAARTGPAPADWAVWPGDQQIVNVPQEGEHTAMGWLVDPDGLERLLARLRTDYPGVPLIVTENGAAYADRLEPDGTVRDDGRIAYLDGHIRAAHRALSAGADLRGYFVWSLLDNFEWSEGFSKRFGIVHVDYGSLRRVPKESARWYSRVVAGNSVPPAESDTGA